MKKRIKKILWDNLWVLILLVDVMMLGLCTYKMMELSIWFAEFQNFMSIYAG